MKWQMLKGHQFVNNKLTLYMYQNLYQNIKMLVEIEQKLDESRISWEKKKKIIYILYIYKEGKIPYHQLMKKTHSPELHSVAFLVWVLIKDALSFDFCLLYPSKPWPLVCIQQ